MTQVLQSPRMDLPTSVSVNTQLSFSLSSSPVRTKVEHNEASLGDIGSPPDLASPSTTSTLSPVSSPSTRNDSVVSIPIYWAGDGIEVEEAPASVDQTLGLGLELQTTKLDAVTSRCLHHAAQDSIGSVSATSTFTISAYAHRSSVDTDDYGDRTDKLGIGRAKSFSRRRADTIDHAYQPMLCSTPQKSLFPADYSVGRRLSYATSSSSYSSYPDSSDYSTGTSSKTSFVPTPTLKRPFQLSSRSNSSYEELSAEDELQQPNEIPFSTDIHLLFDQEGWRETEVKFTLVHRDADTGDLEYKPETSGELVFNAAKLQAAPVLRAVNVGDRNNLTRQASLSVRKNGEWNVCGREGRGKWIFSYRIDDRRKISGSTKSGEKNLSPQRFICSPEVLDPSRSIPFTQRLGRSVMPKLSATRTRASSGTASNSDDSQISGIRRLFGSKSMKSLRPTPDDVDFFASSVRDMPCLQTRPRTASTSTAFKPSRDLPVRPSTANKVLSSRLESSTLVRPSTTQTMKIKRTSTAPDRCLETPTRPKTAPRPNLQFTPPRNSSLPSSRPSTAQTLRIRATSVSRY